MNPLRTTPDRLILQICAALLLGGLQAASFSPPMQSWWLQLASLSGLFLLIDRRPLRRQALLTACFGLIWFAGGLAWLHTSMHVYGGMPWLLAALAVVLFALYLSLFPVAAIAVAVRFSCDTHWLTRALTLGALWGLAEIARGLLFTGFPWLAIGYAHIDGPLSGFASWFGVYGVCALAALCASLTACLARGLSASVQAVRRRSGASRRQGVPRYAKPHPLAPALIAIGVIVLGAALGQIEQTQANGPNLKVRLVQGNVPQQLKFNPGRTLVAMNEYTRWIESSDADLIVLPETAWTLPWNSTPLDIRQRIEAATLQRKSAVAIGMPLAQQISGPLNGQLRYTNSVGLLAPPQPAAGAAVPNQNPRSQNTRSPGADIIARYDKRHLVPFGEFIPPGFAWFVALMQIPLGEFGRGAAQQAPFEIGGQRFGFNICYEDLFGEELLEQVRTPKGASVLVNVSNIAWFGNSHALPQHLAIARMRALETGRPMLRATNTGVTASIDHRGTIQARLAPYTVGALDVQVQGTRGLTAYVRWGQWSTLTLLALMLAAGQVIRSAHLHRTDLKRGKS